jgi:hypothetical protein
MSKSLQGTKSHENLKGAFAGESQANRRYLYFAQKADVEGYLTSAVCFATLPRPRPAMPSGISTFSRRSGILLRRARSAIRKPI